MHGAPSVTYPVGRSRFAAALLALAWLLGVAATLRWSASMQGEGVARSIAAAALVAMLGLFAWFSWARTSQGSLAWDGENWSWATMVGQGQTGAVAVRLDLQRWLLLHWTGDNSAHWLWLARSDQLGHWDDLRRAVYSRPNPKALTGVTPPAATP